MDLSKVTVVVTSCTCYQRSSLEVPPVKTFCDFSLFTPWCANMHECKLVYKMVPLYLCSPYSHHGVQTCVNVGWFIKWSHCVYVLILPSSHSPMSHALHLYKVFLCSLAVPHFITPFCCTIAFLYLQLSDKNYSLLLGLTCGISLEHLL